MKKGITTLLGVALAIGAVAACGKDPLQKDRDVGVFMFTDPSFATMKIDTLGIQITAHVENRYNAPTGDDVTATPCDGTVGPGIVNVAADPLRTEFEAPERFKVKASTSGKTCLVLTGGGLTDTVGIVVQ